jgi:ribulose-phosphate 3-epimerase
MPTECYIAPSILAADFANIEKAVAEIEQSGADWIHLDVMDGHFVPEITFGAKMIAGIRKLTALPLDVHLMADQPAGLARAMAAAGADYITFHAEACVHSHALAAEIAALGKKAGVSIVPATPPAAIEYLLPFVDLVLVMTVNPGAGGQALIPQCLEKTEQLREIRRQKDARFRIAVDGGIHQGTAAEARARGADVLVVGSAFFNAADKAAFVTKIRQM